MPIVNLQQGSQVWLDYQRFLKWVEKTESCWNWKGSLTSMGYGQFWFNKTSTAHRASWKLHFGEIPVGLLICHHCDNKKCVNPDHLFLGTHKDNTKDMISKGRKGKDPQTVITKDKVKEVVFLYKNGMKQRDIAKLFGIKQSNIWKHIRKHIPSQGKSFGEKNCNAKLTKEKVLEMRKMYIPFEISFQKIAKIYGIDTKTAERAIKGITWA